MAHVYEARIVWERGEAVFTDNRYSRAYAMQFDGLTVPGSPAAQNVPPGTSRTEAVDPEEAFVAAVSSCHMLFFLAFAAAAGFCVDRYDDRATGTMTKNEAGKLFVSQVTLRPSITWSGAKRPTDAEIERLHHRAHADCFIANSIRSEVIIAAEPSRFA